MIGLVLTLMACGGGGGGGGGGEGRGGGGGGGGGPSNPTPSPSDGQLYPTPPSDSPDIGAPISHSANGFTFVIGGETVALSIAARDGMHYQLAPKTLATRDPDTNAQRRLYAQALENPDVLIMSGVLTSPLNDPIIEFGVSGDNYFPMLSGIYYYSGHYVASDAKGALLGNWPLEIYLNADNLSASYGADLDGGQTIRIHFDRYAYGALQGSVADPTHDYHDASFNFFGAGGKTLAGGFADGFGAGIVLVERY